MIEGREMETGIVGIHSVTWLNAWQVREHREVGLVGVEAGRIKEKRD